MPDTLPTPQHYDPLLVTRSVDRLLHARQARFTGSLSLVSLTLAYLDWSLHLADAPGRRLELAHHAARQWARLLAPAD